MGGAEPPKFPKITPFRKGPPLPTYKNFPHGGGHGPPSPPLSDGLEGEGQGFGGEKKWGEGRERAKLSAEEAIGEWEKEDAR